MPNGISDWFVNQGILGVLCLVLIGTVGYLWTRLNKVIDDKGASIERVQTARIEDQKQLTAVLDRQNAAAKALIAEVNQMLIDQVRSNDRMTASVASLEKSSEDHSRAIEKVASTVETLRVEQATLAATVKSRGAA